MIFIGARGKKIHDNNQNVIKSLVKLILFLQKFLKNSDDI